MASDRPSELACIVIMDMDVDSTYLYVSESMQDILGYDPQELVGTSPWLLFHPDEVEKFEEIRYQNVLNDKVACIAYCQMRHKNGEYLLCALAYNVVHDKMVGTVSRAIEGPRAMLRSATALEIVEVTPDAARKFTLRTHWAFPGASPGPVSPSIGGPGPSFSSPSISGIGSPSQSRLPLEDLPKPSPRTFLLLNRFTNASTILYVSNEVIITNAEAVTDQSFFDIIRPSDRDKVRQYVEVAKTWNGEGRLSPSGYSFLTFGLINGRETVEVEGILSAYSDGLLCVIKLSTQS